MRALDQHGQDAASLTSLIPAKWQEFSCVFRVFSRQWRAISVTVLAPWVALRRPKPASV